MTSAIIKVDSSSFRNKVLDNSVTISDVKGLALTFLPWKKHQKKRKKFQIDQRFGPG